MTMAISKYAEAIGSGRLDRELIRWYGPDDLAGQKKRYLGLLEEFKSEFGQTPAIVVSAPAPNGVGGATTPITIEAGC